MIQVREAARIRLPTAAGEFDTRAFECSSGFVYLALTRGELGAGENVLARVHSECLTGDALGSLRCDCGVQLGLALRMLAAEGRGVLVYATGHEGRGIGLIDKLRAYMEQEAGADTLDANLRLGLPPDSRRYDEAAAVLAAVGVRSARLITNNPDKVTGLREAGIGVQEVIPLLAAPHLRNRRYLHTKQERFGHLLTVPRLPEQQPRQGIDVAALLGSAQPPPGRPFVLVRYAQTVDGRVTPAGGRSRAASGAEIRVTHALRAACDAVLVGVGTVLSDDPPLTVEAVPGRSPARVILDSRLRSPVSAAAFGPGATTYVMASAQAADPSRRSELAACQIAVRWVEPAGGGLDIHAVMRQLHADGIRSVIVEGGRRVISSVLAAGVADRVVVSVTPLIAGAGAAAVEVDGEASAGRAMRLAGHTVHLVGDAILIAADLQPAASGDEATAAAAARPQTYWPGSAAGQAVNGAGGAPGRGGRR